MKNDESLEILSQQSTAFDPYAPPSAQVAAPVYSTEIQAPLADRGSRFVAQFYNVLTIIPGAGFCGVGASAAQTETGGQATLGIISVALGSIGLIALLVINLRLLGRHGQSLGKKWANVRVVRTDGSPASLGRLVGLRYMVNALPGMIPVIGGFYSLVDILFVFRNDRRCIHDMIADTKVVVA